MKKSRDDIFDKVLFIGPDINGMGGIASVIASYRDHLPKFNYLPTNSRRGTIPGLMRLLLTLTLLPWHRWIRGEQIMHVHSASGKSFMRKRVVMWVGRMLGFRIVFHSHGGNMRKTVESLGRDRYVRILGKCSAVAVLSHEWKNYFSEELGLKNVLILNNIVEHYTEHSVTHDQNVPLQFLFLGKVCPEKGVPDMLEVVAAHKKEFDGKMELRIGGNDKNSIVQPFVDAHHLGGIVHYLGWVSGRRKMLELRNCDVMILPSYIEGLPVSILEAMTAGKGLVTTDVGGIPDIVTTGDNGFMFRPGDKEGLYDAIKAYIDNPALIHHHGEASMERVRGYYPECVVESLESLYRPMVR